MTPAEVLKYAEKNGAKFVDFKFVDLLGIWQHTTMPIAQAGGGILQRGLRLRRQLHPRLEGDQRVRHGVQARRRRPPSWTRSTPSRRCRSSATSRTRSPASRTAATRATSPARPSSTSSRPASATPRTSVPSPSSSSSRASASTRARTPRSTRSTRPRGAGTPAGVEGPNLGYKPAFKGGYFPVAADRHPDRHPQRDGPGARGAWASRSRSTTTRWPAVVSASCRMRFNSLVKMADWTMWYKYVVKNVARRHGKVATFMPKPIFGDNGSGMHCHQSIWKDEKNLFAGDKYAGSVGHGAQLHRRPAQARALVPGHHQPGPEQLPPAGAGLRGAGEPGLLVAQPLGRRSASRSRAPRPRPSGSSSAAPIRPPTPTSPSRRC